MEVKDLLNKTIEVTDLKKAIAEATMFSTYSDKTSPKEVNQLAQAYWIDMLKKLRKLALAEMFTIIDAIVIPTGEELLPEFVRVIRAERRERLALMGTTPDAFNGKLFSKDGKKSPLFGAHSCVKTDQNLSKLDSLEIGETWKRFGQPSITRIF